MGAFRSVMDYQEFLHRKSQLGGLSGFEPIWMPDFLDFGEGKGFQHHSVDWAIRKGRAALFQDCGLGKTPQQLVWAENIIRKTNKPVLILTPLAVAGQTAREADKFSIDAKVSRDGTVFKNITVANYERLHYFKPDSFSGVVCDESSCLKAMDGTRRWEVTEFLRLIPYRLLCTATAAPNDYVELGTSSEALGEMGQRDMITMFFKQETKKDYLGWGRVKYRMRGHAETHFWKWVCSWARACRKPSDLGFDDSRFILPPLIETPHIVKSRTLPEGFLFEIPARDMQEERAERRRTINERCEKVAELVSNHSTSAIWCHLNDEGDLLEKFIPNSLQVSGSDSTEYKEMVAEWFVGNKCLCNEPMFRVKIAAWQKDRLATGKSIIDNIVSNGSLSRLPTKESTEPSGKDTCRNTTEQTKENGNERQAKKSKGVKTGELDTLQTPNTESSKSKRRGNTALPIQKQGPSENLPSSEFPSTNTANSLNLAVPSAEGKQTSTCEGQSDSTSTIATKQENSVESSARLVILDSESSKTIQTFLKVQQCICGCKSGIRRLISKPKIFGWGLNFQHCSHVVTFASHSYESYYQAIRRCWRFGQENPVKVDYVITEGEQRVSENLDRKSKAADRMFTNLVSYMNESMKVDKSEFKKKEKIPSWL